MSRITLQRSEHRQIGFVCNLGQYVRHKWPKESSVETVEIWTLALIISELGLHQRTEFSRRQRLNTTIEYIFENSGGEFIY